MVNSIKISLLALLHVALISCASAQRHPSLMLTPESVAHIRSGLGSVPLFDRALKATKAEVDAEIAAGIDVPVPKDMAGGYTHERHKKNFFILQKAGVLFQITGDEKYAVYVRDMLMEYAKLYPTLGLHPTNRSYATGKIFWQCLNDANWLVYVSQAYDCIYDWLKPEQVKYLNETLFRPFADFLSVENPQFFNRIHNHSTWGNAAVGMIGLVMDDEELVNRALYGLQSDGISSEDRDNDGGFIKPEGQKKAGFLAQLDGSFSPDGYFTEGPYYLRYAIYPFMIFAKALANKKPELKIFEYRDSILKKAVFALFYQTDLQGRYFPINDAQKGMSWLSRESITAVDLTYFECGKEPMLLSIAKLQGEVLLDEAGYAVASDLAKGLAKPFRHRPMAFTDGPNGKKGGLAILRNNYTEVDELCAVVKYSAQGMGHGHFDKLSYSLYDGVGEVIQDYGAARWVNIDQKGGGRYLPENNSWAKQSIAHNTLVINEISHYKGDVKTGEANHPDLYYFDADNTNLQVVSAVDSAASPGSVMHRTVVLLTLEEFEKPLLIDVFRVRSDKPSQYDLPVWFQGHLLTQNFDYQAETQSLTPMGSDFGYQHLWKETAGSTADGNAQITWFGNGRFYSLTTIAAPEDELIFARLGANDPNFNLRRDPAFIHRKKGLDRATFVSVIEPHGAYNPVEEIPLNPFPHVQSLRLELDTEAYTALSFERKEGGQWLLILTNNNASKVATHQLEIKGETVQWTGPFHLIKKG